MITAFIPLRSGSKSIKDKNIKPFNGKPLCYWVLKTCQESNLIDKVVVAIDCNDYKNIISSFSFNKIEFFIRQSVNSQDTSTTESVILEYLNNNKISGESTFILDQATSPHLNSKEMDDMISKSHSNKCDIVSCVRIKRFTWSEDGIPLNYDILNRPRRQNFNGILIENGAVYISRVDKILNSNCRLSGNIKPYEMNKKSFVEIDEPDDFFISEFLMKQNHL